MNILGKLEAKSKFQNFAKIRASENSKKRGKLTKLKFGDFQNFCHSDKLNISSKIKFSQQAIFVNSAKIRGMSKSEITNFWKKMKFRKIRKIQKLEKTPNQYFGEVGQIKKSSIFRISPRIGKSNKSQNQKFRQEFKISKMEILTKSPKTKNSTIPSKHQTSKICFFIIFGCSPK